MRLALIALVVLVIAPYYAFSHPGRTASDGCHYCRTNCSRWGEVSGARHCHNRGSSSSGGSSGTSTPRTATQTPSRVWSFGRFDNGGEYVTAYNQDRSWYALVYCEPADRLWLVWKQEVAQVDDPAPLRLIFGERTVQQAEMCYSTNVDRAVCALDENIADLLLEHGRVRVDVPAQIVNQQTDAVVRFDLSDFDRAWRRCE